MKKRESFNLSLILIKFIYKDLYKSDEGKMIDYFNGQFYFDFSSESFNQVVENGYPSEKIVIGMISSQDFNNAKKEIKNRI